MVLTKEKVHHISINDKNSIVQQLATKAIEYNTNPPFVFVVNFVIPLGSFVIYFTSDRDEPSVGDSKFDALMNRFLTGSDEFRNDRLKLIPSVTDGSWIVKNACGSKPAILGRKIPMAYYRGNHHFEVVVDVTQNPMARSVCGLVAEQLKHLSICLAFVLEGRNSNELPERILGAIQFSRLDLMQCRPLERASKSDLQ